MGRSGKITRRVIAASILFITIFAFRAVSPAIEDANWQSILQHFHDSFHSSGDALRDFSARLDAQSRQFAGELARLEKSKGQLMLIYGGSYDPSELLVVLQGLATLRSEAEDRFQWFADSERELENTANKIADLKAEHIRQSMEPSAGRFKDALAGNLTEISSLEPQMLLIRQGMEKSREAYNSFLSRLDEAERSVRGKTATYWKIFYLKNMPGLFSEDLFKTFRKETRKWAAECVLVWDMVRSPEELQRIRGLILKISASLLLFVLAGSAVSRKFGNSPEGRAGLSSLLTLWLLFGLWTSITWFGAGAPFSISDMVQYTGEQVLSLVLLYAAIVFGRRYASPERVALKAVFPLWVLHIVSLEFRVLNFSYGMALTAWIFSLAACVLYMYRKRPAGADRRERWPYLAATYLVPVLIAFAALGYLTLSILVLSTIVYGWLSVDLCVSLLKGLRGFAKETRGNDKSTIGALSTLGFPVAVLTLGYLNLWVLSLHTGGPDVLGRMLSAGLAWDTYRINLKILSLIVLGFYTTRALVLLVESLALRDSNLDAGVIEVIQKTSKYLFWGFFATGVLSLLGFSLMSLTVVAGGLSVGIGFGLQQIVNNFFSGLILLLGRSIQPGDTIQIGDMLGDVRKVTVRNTVVQTRDNATVFIPNSELLTNNLINWSHRDRRIRLTVAVGVAYGSDTEKVRKLLLQAARSVQGVLPIPSPDVLFFNFGASTLDFKLRFWIGNLDRDAQFLSQVRYEIDRLFRENEIEIAFPQSTLHIQSAPALEKLLTARDPARDFGEPADTM